MSEQMSGQDCWTEGQGAVARKPVASRPLGADTHAMLVATVKQAVIPRLVALPWVARVSDVLPLPVLDEAAVETLLALSLDADAHGVAMFIAGLHRAGVRADSIYEHLLTPVARQLGVMWENDDCTFADVTIAVLRLQNAQRALAPDFVGDRVADLNAPRALLLPVPGEQHTFGLSLVMDYFLRAGWEARLGVPGTEAEAMAQVRAQRTDLVGLSFACDDHVPTAVELIQGLRKASPNKDLVIMVGGPSFVTDPTLAERVGADATALDGHQAVLRANELLHRPILNSAAGPA